jgi:hypothetical protein
MNTIGKWIFLAGCILAFVGLIVWIFGDKLNWIGRLPGDIRIEKENFKVFFPITTMLLVSISISLLVKLIQYIRSMFF